MSTPRVEILSRAEWPGQGRREDCEVSAPRAHPWGRGEEKVGILSQDASPRAQVASGWDPRYPQASLLSFLGPGCSGQSVCSAALGREVCCLSVLEFIKV